MVRSHFSAVRQKSGIIYVTLNHIHMIKMFSILFMNIIHGNVNILGISQAMQAQNISFLCLQFL